MSEKCPYCGKTANFRSSNATWLHINGKRRSIHKLCLHTAAREWIEGREKEGA